MSHAARLRVKNVERHPSTGDGGVGELISVSRPRRTADASTGGNLKWARHLAVDSADGTLPDPKVVNAIIRIGSDLVASEIVRGIGDVADRDRARITHSNEDPLAIRTDRGSRICWRLEDLHQIGWWRLIRLLRRNGEQRREHQARYRQEATIREGDHGNRNGGWIDAAGLTTI